MPGYSGTPLPKKLGIEPRFRVRLVNAPDEVLALLAVELAECEVVDRRTELDFAMLFVGSRKDLIPGFAKLESALAPAGMLWISWPKKSSGMVTDLTENTVREVGLEAGLVDVKVCAVTDVWSGLKFVRRLVDRKKSLKPMET